MIGCSFRGDGGEWFDGLDFDEDGLEGEAGDGCGAECCRAGICCLSFGRGGPAAFLLSAMSLSWKFSAKSKFA